MFLTAGTLLDGKYEILGTIGSGGMGIVYEARQPNLQRVVAVKMLRTTTTGDAEDLARFEREAIILSRLRHPNIVQFYAYGISEQTPYIVIERVNGCGLHQMLTKQHSLGSTEALEIARQMCAALEYAHAQGVLHRDLKPSNAVVGENSGGQRIVKLIDFGLARVFGWDHFQKLTQAGVAVGNVVYASPEQCLGDVVDSRSDIYAFGCVLYEMLTGSAPFGAENATAMMFQHLNDSVRETPNWPKVPAEIQPMIAKCMDKDKEKRYTSAAQLIQEIDNLIAGKPCTAEMLPEHTARKPSRLPAKTLGIAFAIAVTTTIGLVSYNAFDPNESRQKATAGSVADELTRLVYANNIGTVNEETAQKMLSLIEQYKREPSFNDDLLFRSYTRTIGYFKGIKNYARVRSLCSAAFEHADHLSNQTAYEYFGLVWTYHDACLPARCQYSIIGLLEKSIDRWPNAEVEESSDVSSIHAVVSLSLAVDYFQLGRIDDARKIANRIIQSARHPAQVRAAMMLLEKCKAK